MSGHPTPASCILENLCVATAGCLLKTVKSMLYHAIGVCSVTKYHLQPPRFLCFENQESVLNLQNNFDINDWRFRESCVSVTTDTIRGWLSSAQVFSQQIQIKRISYYFPDANKRLLKEGVGLVVLQFSGKEEKSLWQFLSDWEKMNPHVCLTCVVTPNWEISLCGSI